MFPLSVYATQALHGMVYGMLLFLVASGLTLVFGMMGILNIAHAGLLYARRLPCLHHRSGRPATSGSRSWSPRSWSGSLGAAVERGLLRRTHAFGHAYELLLTFGLFFMLGGGGAVDLGQLHAPGADTGAARRVDPLAGQPVPGVPALHPGVRAG